MQAKGSGPQRARPVWKKRIGELLLLYISLSMAWLAWMDLQPL
ncbi:hypothetical protein [Neptuniibacter halophilus]|nr:hypothetical protein [Neptuniibacter halophilus]